MTIGATAGKTPDYIEDSDVLSVKELRGAMGEVIKAKKSLGELATLEGLRSQIAAMHKQMEIIKEQMTRVLGIYGTLRNEFNQLQVQRVKELTMRMNGGSTVTEDR